MKSLRLLVAVMLLQLLGITHLSAQEVLLSYGQSTQQPWEAKYFKSLKSDATTPGDDWYAIDFDDSSWDSICGPISGWGENLYYATKWNTNVDYAYWVRRHFSLDTLSNEVRLVLNTVHDDGCTIYLNGNLLYSYNGVVNSTKTVILTAEQASFLRKGDNVVAATVNNGGGAEAYMDFGLGYIITENGISYSGTTALEVIDKSLTEYTIKEGTTLINSDLFKNCNNMVKCTIPESVTSIGNNAFYYCQNLKEINIPSNVNNIGSNAFYYCSNLDSLNYNAINCTSANSNIFDGCSNLKTIIIGDSVKTIPAYLFYDDNVQTVIMGNSVTKIGNYAFYSCDNLQGISFPDRVDSIGYEAFRNCSNLKSVNIPINTKFIDNYAFRNCSALDSIHYNAANTPTFSDNIFYNCSNIKKITIGNDTKVIPTNLTYGRTSLQKVEIGENVTTISDNAFYNCQSLKSVNIPKSIEYIGNNAFQNCYALDSVVFNLSNCTSSYIFANCSNLKTVTIGDDVKRIPSNMFRECDKLKNITMGDKITYIDSYAFYGCDSLAYFNIPNSVDTIGYEAFRDCKNLKSVNIPINTKLIDNYAFRNCYALDSIYYNAANTPTFSDNIFYNCSSIKKLTIGDDVKVIPTNLTYGRSSLQKVEIGESVTTISDNTFYNCQGLKSVNIPKNIYSIGNYAFRYCYALDSIYFNASNCSNLSSNVFDNCSSLRAATIGNDVRNIPSNLFYDRTSLKKVEIGENVTRIKDQAFYNCQGLESINIPNSVDTIGNNVFYNCVSLPMEDTIRYADTYALAVLDKSQTSYTLKENTRFLGTDLFKDCSAMTSIDIPSGVKAIGDNAFYGCTALTSLTLPDAVNSIGSSAFYNCSALASVNIPSGVSTIGNNMFYGCTALTSLTLPETVNSIGTHAFYNCSALASVNIPSGVQAIGNYTFHGCTALTSLTLPETVNSIGTYAFYNCSALASVNIPSGVPTIGDYTFHGCTALTSLTLPETVNSIGTYAFYNCSALTSMTIPASVTSIANYAFYNCIGIEELILADGKETLSLGYNGWYEKGLFGYCQLKKVNLGRNLSYNTDYYYGYSPFCDIQTLTDVTIGDSVTYIPNYAFYNCDDLASIEIPKGVTKINTYAFYDCDRLRDAKLPETLETIENYNFNHSYLTIVSDATTPPTFQGGCSGKVIYVPAGSGEAYRELYPDNTIIDGDGVTVRVNITELGTLGEEALKQADYLYDINHLIVSGTLDNSDIQCITNSMSNLISIDMSGMNMSSIPSSLFKNNKVLTKATLPNKTTSIGSEAFRDCSRLQEVVLPDNLQQIGNYAFYQSGLEDVTLPDNVNSMGSYTFYNCDLLKSINIPAKVKRLENYLFDDCRLLQDVAFSDSLTYIGDYVFRNCPSLTSIILPNTVTQISTGAFYGCSSLTSVTFPQSINTIGNDAFRGSALNSVEIASSLASLGTYSFYDCNNLETVTLHGATTIGQNSFASCDILKEVYLPGSLHSCGNNIFNGCGQMQSVTCEAIFPPTVSTIVPNNTCVLYAPDWTLEKYKLSDGWSAFMSIEPISGVYPSDIVIQREETLLVPEDGLPQDYKPNMTITSSPSVGKLSVRGTMPMMLSHYEMQQTRTVSTMTSLINKGSISADSVVMKISMSANNWHYLTFPYDVKVSDIITEGGDWTICYYDGEARAQNDLGNTWKTVPYDSILHASEGYIWHSTNGNFTVPAMRNDNRNLIFAKDMRYIQLIEHAASTTANYGWNLIGNPYPCFYDTRFMDFTSPITVRNGSSYKAYSPVDDSYILTPNEAFFVQCSAENNVVGFDTEGRQTNNTVRTLETSASARVRKSNNDRRVFNLYLENESYADHTRFVINEEASLAYEITCDAAKFMSDDPAVQQLFTIEGEERMAINERPLANGDIILGVYFGKAGNYTFNLDTRATDMEVILVDKYTSTEIDLLTDAYVFNTEAGTFTDRFVIRVKRTSDIVDTIDATPETEVKVVAVSGAICITNATSPVYVYNAAGALVATTNENTTTLEMEPGMYVIMVGDKAHKVSVVK